MYESDEASKISAAFLLPEGSGASSLDSNAGAMCGQQRVPLDKRHGTPTLDLRDARVYRYLQKSPLLLWRYES